MRWAPFTVRRQLVACFFASLLASACQKPAAPVWPGFDGLKQGVPQAPRVLAKVPVSEADYQKLLRYGADWFRYETFGGERTITDLVGFLSGPVEVPCTPSSAGACSRQESALSYFVRAIDDLDGVRGNLYTGNGGFDGPGTTRDLVLRFPKGSRVRGLPLPEEVHTGLDVEAGSAWPIGIVPVPARDEARDAPYVWDLAKLGVGPAPDEPKIRVGISCALCHYSLDVDWDGRLDVRSADMDRPTPGSRYRPEHTWAVGNQDLKVGWLFALSQNPLVGALIFSGPIGEQSVESSLQWVKWLKQNYRAAPDMVAREVVRGMLLQPRGYADVSSNARFNAAQFAVLYTQHYWPSNSDGAVLNGADRNSVVWTSTIDFSGLVALTRDRAGSNSGILYWEERSVYSLFTARELAELFVHRSPAVLFRPGTRQALVDDILGVSDGVPGLLDPNSLFVMQGPGDASPESLRNHPENLRNHRVPRAEDFGGDARERGPMLALLGIRAHTRPEVAKAIQLDRWVERYPTLDGNEFMGEAVNVTLDWQPSPPNLTERLARARALVPRGYEVFKSEGCAVCHRGPYYTDNVIHRLSPRRSVEIGIAAASTAPWRALGRGTGPSIGSDPERTVDSRPLSLYVAPSYDPNTGLATGAGGPLRGFFGNQVVGYKTTQLRYAWGSAPYLHDGGVGVAISPLSAVDRDDLVRVLKLPATEKIYGMGHILAEQELYTSLGPRADAALSLQALVLREERERIVAHRKDAVIPVPGVPGAENPLGAPERVSAANLGIEGIGHDFYIDDEPGGERVSALVAFLLAIDDAPGDLPVEAKK